MLRPYDPRSATLKSPSEQAAMRIAGRLTADVLDMIGAYVVAGATTDDLDRRCHDYIVEVQKAIPAPLNYKGFPKSICTSVNHVVCHGIPGDKRLKNGDIVNVDVTVIKDGWHGDASRMFLVGTPSVQAKRLTELCHEALWIGIDLVRPGTHLGDIGHAIQTFVEGSTGSDRGARVLRPRHWPRLPRGSAGAALRRARHRASPSRPRA